MDITITISQSKFDVIQRRYPNRDMSVWIHNLVDESINQEAREALTSAFDGMNPADQATLFDKIAALPDSEKA